MVRTNGAKSVNGTNIALVLLIRKCGRLRASRRLVALSSTSIWKLSEAHTHPVHRGLFYTSLLWSLLALEIRMITSRPLRVIYIDLRYIKCNILVLPLKPIPATCFTRPASALYENVSCKFPDKFKTEGDVLCEKSNRCTSFVIEIK